MVKGSCCLTCWRISWCEHVEVPFGTKLSTGFLEIIFSKHGINRELSTVFGVVMAILGKNNHRESIVCYDESVFCFRKQVVFSNDYCILVNILHKSRGIYL